MNNIYINIKDVAEAKGLKSTRSLRLELNKKIVQILEQLERQAKTNSIQCYY